MCVSCVVVIDLLFVRFSGFVLVASPDSLAVTAADVPGVLDSGISYVLHSGGDLFEPAGGRHRLSAVIGFLTPYLRVQDRSVPLPL